MNQVKQLFSRYKMLALVIAVAVIWVFFSWQTEGGFLTPRNLSNLLRQMSITGILACGMVLVIISGEIDLSVGSLLGLLGGLAAILALSLCYGAYMTEIFRAGIESISRGQTEGATALGLGPSQTMWLVILPQAMRVIIPPTGNQFIAMLKDSSLVSVVGVWERLGSPILTVN